jgi:hypothetical protein
MKCALVVLDSKTGYRESRGIFDVEAAKREVEKKYQNQTTELVAVPNEVYVGFKIYRNGQLYGTVIDESKYLWIVRRAGTSKSYMPDAFIKSSFRDKYVNKVFEVSDEEEELQAPVLGHQIETIKGLYRELEIECDLDGILKLDVRLASRLISELTEKAEKVPRKSDINTESDDLEE